MKNTLPVQYPSFGHRAVQASSCSVCQAPSCFACNTPVLLKFLSDAQQKKSFLTDDSALTTCSSLYRYSCRTNADGDGIDTGDNLHFGLARLMAHGQGIKNVELVVVGDDVSVPRSRGEMVGRRCLAGITLGKTPF